MITDFCQTHIKFSENVAERKESSKMRKAEKKKEKDEVQLRKHGGQGLGGAARQTTREEDARQFRGTLQPHKRGLPAAGRGTPVKKGKGLSKKTKAACRAGDARGEASGMREEEEGRECAVHGFTTAATHPTQGCIQGSMRCDRQDHIMGSCRGATGTVACECSIVEGGTDRRGRNRGKAPGDPSTGTAGGKGMTMADKERTAMDRCYEVDIGDRVEIDTHDEGTDCAGGGHEHAVEGRHRV